jgi:hypothetical protein
VPITVLSATVRLCTLQAVGGLIAALVSGQLVYPVLVATLSMILVDGWMRTWVHRHPNNDTVKQITKVVSISGQAIVIVILILLMPFYNVPLVRVGFSFVAPPLLSLGLAQNISEAIVLLLVNGLVVGACESDWTVLFGMAFQACWLVLGAWKGSRLRLLLEREKSFLIVSTRMVQRALKVLLDCALVVEQVDVEGTFSTGIVDASDSSVWRVREDDRTTDLFSGTAMQGTEVRDMFRFGEDRQRVAEALHAATEQRGHMEHDAVPLMLNGLRARCSALSGCAGSIIERAVDAAEKFGSGDFVYVYVDLVIIGTPWSTALIGVRVAQTPPNPRTERPSLTTSAKHFKMQSDRVPGSCSPSRDDDSDSASSHSSSFGQITEHQQAQSVTMVVDALTEELRIERMTFNFPLEDTATRGGSIVVPGLVNWLRTDGEVFSAWIEETINRLENGQLDAAPREGPIRLFCGSRAFLVAASAEVQRLADDGVSESPPDSRRKASLKVLLHLNGISRAFWPPWADSPSERHITRHKQRRRTHDQLRSDGMYSVSE